MTDQSAFEQLLGFDLFSGFSLPALRKHGDQFSRRSFGAGDQIIEVKGDDSGVYFLLTGSVRVQEYTMSGAELELARITAPGYFGELTAIDSSPRSAEVVALEPCDCLVMTSEDFRAFLMANPEAMMSLLQRLARQIRKANFEFALNAPL